MPDIFISYSRKDSEHAEQLAERLRSNGIEVWIDKSGIEAAKSWSKEIVRAIDDCKAFVVLISTNSQESVNVSREVGIASESKKPMLPIALEDIKLSDELRYHLSGIQRVAYTQFDAITQALANFGIQPSLPDGTAHPGTAGENPLLFKEGAGGGPPRKSLMILPFQDLSPTGDNGWFADGIVSELISALSNVKALNVTDAQTTKDFKRYQGTLPNYAREMQVRYFVEGDVRKFGDQIKISARLLDIETGDHLWQASIKATMADIFEVQEQVANKVVEGLKLHITSDEKKKLTERGTENTEAYELFLKASEYFERQTKEGLQIAAQLFTEAFRLDAGYANAYQCKASALASLYRRYDLDPALLEEAERLCQEALRIKPNLAAVYGPLSVVYMLQGKLAEAEAAAQECIRLAPENSGSHFSLGFFYSSIGEPAKAIAPYEASVRVKPVRVAHFNLAIACHEAKETEKCREWSLAALPAEERHLKLHPDDENSRMQFTALLYYAGKTEQAHAEATKLKAAKDCGTLYNTACLFAMLGDKREALLTFRKAIEAGFKNIRHLKLFLTEEDEDIAQLAGTAEYEEVKRMVEKLESEAKNG